MINERKWRFPLSGRNFRTGIKDAGIESFTGNRIHSLAKEICQNSLDAKIKSNNDPVIVEFKQYKLLRSKFPNIEGLKYSLEQSLETSRNLKDQDALAFFENALKVVNKPYIPFLRVSDFNTTGLKGVNKISNSNWADLVRSAGVSNKSGDSGGSFGIGKNATYATSDLRTIFYSTLTIDEEKATQGVANLISYDIFEKNDFTQGRGHYALNDNQDPIDELIQLDPEFIREQSGTDIFISGYSFYNNNSKTDIISSVLDTYLYAIFENTLVLYVDNEIINKDTIDEIIFKYKDSIKKTTYELYNLLSSTKVKIFKETIEEKDDLEIRVILNPKGSRRVSMIRNPWMKIKELDRFPSGLLFEAVAIIKGERLNEVLRQVENPQHDDWEPERISNNPQLKLKAEKILKEMRSKILEKINEIYEPEIEDVMDIFGAGDKIPFEENESNEKSKRPKVEDKVSSVEIQAVETATKVSRIDKFTEQETEIILVGGDDQVMAPIPPENEKSSSKNPTPVIDEFNKGKKIGLKKGSVRVISINKDKGLFRIVLDLDNYYNNTHIIAHVLDESGNIIKSNFKIFNATVNNQTKNINNNIITNCFLSKGRNIIDIETNLNMYVGIGVEVSDIQR